MEEHIILYTVHHAHGESAQHPNMFRLRHRGGRQIVMGDVVDGFPIRGSGVPLQIAFMTNSGKYLVCKESNRHQAVPRRAGTIYCRVNSLDGRGLERVAHLIDQGKHGARAADAEVEVRQCTKKQSSARAHLKMRMAPSRGSRFCKL